jgi:Toastrack DUF4097
MQNQQEFEHTSSTSEETPAPIKDRQINTDPREQPVSQESMYRSYEEGYVDQSERAYWPFEGEKLQPEPKNEKSMGGLLALIVLLCLVFVLGSLFGAILSWLTWVVVIVLIIAGLAALATNWRIVTIPMPTRTFQIMEHARLVINNGSGTVSIRRGEEGMVSVTATKRASGFGIDPERMQINYNQNGDTLDISSHMAWSLLQFGLRTVDLEITVPSSCDVHLQNGGGRVALQGTSGVMLVRTGGGRIEAYDLQGQIAIKTGGGRIDADNLQGSIDLRTGGGRIEAQNLQGQINLLSGGSPIMLGNMSGQLTAVTGGGRIEVSQAALSGESSLKTGGGAINVSLAEDVAFSLDAKTGGGTIYNEFGSDEVGKGPHARLKIRTGGGGIRIYRGQRVPV